ncbi:MAG: glutamine-hydrolyzing carbamoyl-phosphate synthase small subunit [Dehalococcoidales bacterium]|jgi:carbamoyl-phosphate synthase small subunit
MAKPAILVLADGSTYEGYSFGAATDAVGEAVFNTSMAGYQEMLTDPSYAGQILMPTYPLIGNYGTNAEDGESRRIQVRGFAVREKCDLPSHYLNNNTVHAYLAAGGIPGIWGLDTRAITRRLRSAGVMMGMITSTKTPAEALAAIRNAPDYGDIDFVREVTTEKPYGWGDNGNDLPYHVVALDCGLKYNILRLLAHHGCRSTVVPCTASAEEILALEPDGILLSPGPGDPDKLDYLMNTVKKLIGKKPMMGICLGNQMINRAFGGKHFKLKFGHRGGNHPVRDLASGRIHITAQNHGYAADPSTIGQDLEVTHINLNDGTVEGLRHKELPIFAVQYHSEASPGPLDNVYLFRQFVENIKQGKS